MVVLLGKLEDFDKSKEDWTQYVEHMGHFFSLRMRKGHLNTVCRSTGSQGYKHTDRQVHKMEDDVTESTDGEDEYELFANNSSKKTKPCIHSQAGNRRKTGTYGN